jgi:hypothetical protein
MAETSMKALRPRRIRGGITAVLCLIGCLAVATAASARESFRTYPVQQALEKGESEQLLADVALYFGDQEHPAVVHDFGEFATNKKTNTFGKSDRAACDWVFLSAVIQLQQRALQEGGNAVINIKSNYKNIEFVSDDEYRCGAGNIMAGVALKGTVVTIEK